MYRDTLRTAKDTFSKQIPSCVPESPPVAPVFNQINKIFSLIPSLSRNYFNILLPPVPNLLKQSVLFILSTKTLYAYLRSAISVTSSNKYLKL